MPTVRLVDLASKVALVVLLVVAAVFPDLGGLKGKASGARLVVYPLGMLAVPLWWWLYGRRRAARRGGDPGFPWAADLLATLPWLLDTLGNRLNLFDTISWWDDGMHFLNWLLLTAGVLLAWSPAVVSGGVSGGVSRAVVVMCGLAFGMGAALLWELGEYAAFLRGSPELQTAYTDTLGDLTLGSLGSLVAGVLVGWRLGGQPARATAGR